MMSDGSVTWFQCSDLYRHNQVFFNSTDQLVSPRPQSPEGGLESINIEDNLLLTSNRPAQTLFITDSPFSSSSSDCRGLLHHGSSVAPVCVSAGFTGCVMAEH
ncbi:Hypothetical predicted protein [Xyrichtys novacula]|uniref:Uncharacterized protein n=1 Tax=Xyrichtys novacula TaxID=13765 RepID=A0AAV1FSR0_XYRNO|nr:Hypothetical predicted protein [Xyrichtys novacula]